MRYIQPNEYLEQFYILWHLVQQLPRLGDDEDNKFNVIVNCNTLDTGIIVVTPSCQVMNVATSYDELGHDFNTTSK